jgi:hypothetical protein
MGVLVMWIFFRAGESSKKILSKSASDSLRSVSSSFFDYIGGFVGTIFMD